MRRHLSPCKRLSPLTICRCSKYSIMMSPSYLFQASMARHNLTLESAQDGSFMCSTLTSFLRPGCIMHAIFGLTFLSPGWVRAPQGWLLAVQGHVDQVQGLLPSDEDVRQVVKLESCLFQGRHCEYLPPCYKSSCLQLFSPFPLISIDPNRPEQPPVIALIPLPSACSCLVLY